MFVCCVCCVLSGSGLCDGLIAHPGECGPVEGRAGWGGVWGPRWSIGSTLPSSARPSPLPP
jgi:hypothetical protein